MSSNPLIDGLRRCLANIRVAAQAGVRRLWAVASVVIVERMRLNLLSQEKSISARSLFHTLITRFITIIMLV